ncbi:MAG: motility associated factor glycosyltransferase family protein [Campylobacterales bacterium]|nr:motility associated factor glycosyltransferase family protein [Campylobacterales bacterium]
MSLFETNLNALRMQNPLLSESFQQLGEELPYEIFMENDNVETLNLVHTTTFKPLYATKPQEVIGAQKEQFKVFQEYPYLYIFGLGNGALLKHLLANPKHERIVVIEPDAYIAYVVLNLVDFSKELTSNRLVILGKDALNFPTISALFSTFETQRYAKLYDLHISSAFYGMYEELIMQSNRLFIECLHQNVQSAGNDMHDALVGVEHHFMNLPLMLKTPPLLQFFKQAKTTEVAVLVSTGPSLAKQLPLLKEMAPYITIFAVDASFPVLTRYGIKPDVVVSMERIPLTGRFFKETPKEAFEGVVFSLSSLQHPEVVGSIKAGVMQMNMRPFGYMMETGAPAWGYVGIGMSAANKAYELIYHSGFKTCVLIGQDLAYSDEGKSHSAGHVFGEDEVKHKAGDGFVERYGGGGLIKTTAVWNWFRAFFEKDIAETKEHMQTINATEGGARIFGAIERAFKEVMTTVDKSRIKKPIALTPLHETELKRVQQEVAHNVEAIRSFLAQQRTLVETLFLKTAALCEALEANKNVTLEQLEALEAQILAVRKRVREERFERLIWHVGQSMLLVQEMDLARIEVRFTCNEEERYEKLSLWIQAHKGWLFALAGCIDAIQVAMERKGSHYEKNAEVKA